MNTFLVLLCTTKLKWTHSQYYCVLQSLQKALPSTTVYYKACTNTFPVLQSLHKVAAFPIDTATPEEKQRRRFCSFPIDTATWAHQNDRGFAAFPIETELTTRKRPKNDATTNWRRTRVQPPDPQTINGNPSLRIREQTEQLTSRNLREPCWSMTKVTKAKGLVEFLSSGRC